MDANNNIHDGEVTKALLEVGIFKTVVSNHDGESVPTTCATNKQRKAIESIWTSPGLTVLKCDFLTFHEVYGFNYDHQLFWADISQAKHQQTMSTSTGNSNGIRKQLNGTTYYAASLRKTGGNSTENTIGNRTK